MHCFERMKVMGIDSWTPTLIRKNASFFMLEKYILLYNSDTYIPWNLIWEKNSFIKWNIYLRLELTINNFLSGFIEDLKSSTQNKLLNLLYVVFFSYLWIYYAMLIKNEIASRSALENTSQLSINI